MDNKLLDLIKEILSNSDKLIIDQAISCTEYDFISNMHHSLGRQIRNNYFLCEPLSQIYSYMKHTFGLWHPDDMSTLVIQTLWCYIHNCTPNYHKTLLFFKTHWDIYDPENSCNIKLNYKS